MFYSLTLFLYNIYISNKQIIEWKEICNVSSVNII